jgi:glutathionyl-hydroquinone reductase
MLSSFRTLIGIVAQRTLIVRKLKGLEEFIPYTSVHWEMLEKGTNS